MSMVDTIYQKLTSLYPNCIDGYIGGQASAIVGVFGLHIYAYSDDGTKHSKHYNEGDLIPIIKFDETGIVFSPFLNEFKSPYEKFKGLEYKTQLL